MSEILGYDCDGRALRAGGRMVFVGGEGQNCQFDDIGNPSTVIGPVLAVEGSERVELNDGDPVYTVWVRLNNSGRELFDKCASEAGKIKSGETA